MNILNFIILINLRLMKALAKFRTVVKEEQISVNKSEFLVEK